MLMNKKEILNLLKSEYAQLKQFLKLSMTLIPVSPEKGSMSHENLLSRITQENKQITSNQLESFCLKLLKHDSIWQEEFIKKSLLKCENFPISSDYFASWPNLYSKDSTEIKNQLTTINRLTMKCNGKLVTELLKLFNPGNKHGKETLTDDTIKKLIPYIIKALYENNGNVDEKFKTKIKNLIPEEGKVTEAKRKIECKDLKLRRMNALARLLSVNTQLSPCTAVTILEKEIIIASNSAKNPKKNEELKDALANKIRCIQQYMADKIQLDECVSALEKQQGIGNIMGAEASRRYHTPQERLKADLQKLKRYFGKEPTQMSSLKITILPPQKYNEKVVHAEEVLVAHLQKGQLLNNRADDPIRIGICKLCCNQCHADLSKLDGIMISGSHGQGFANVKQIVSKSPTPPLDTRPKKGEGQAHSDSMSEALWSEHTPTSYSSDGWRSSSQMVPYKNMDINTQSDNPYTITSLNDLMTSSYGGEPTQSEVNLKMLFDALSRSDESPRTQQDLIESIKFLSPVNDWVKLKKATTAKRTATPNRFYANKKNYTLFESHKGHTKEGDDSNRPCL